MPGASAIQTVLDRTEWAQQAGNPAAYAPFVDGPKTIVQFGTRRQDGPEPDDERDPACRRTCRRATLFRNDLAYAATGAVAKNPHTFLTNLTGAGAVFALQAQRRSRPSSRPTAPTTIDPDGAGPFFETPTSMVPEDLAYIP